VNATLKKRLDRNLERYLGFWASVFVRRSRPRIVAVTGSVGKTTTTAVIAAVLSQPEARRLVGSVRKSFGSLNNNMGLPLSVLGFRSFPISVKQVLRVVVAAPIRALFARLSVVRAETLVLEYAAGPKSSMTRHTTIAPPAVAVVTHIGSDHRAAFGSVEAIAEEKRKLVAALPADGTAILNADDPLVVAMRSRFGGTVLTYGRAPDATVRGEAIRSEWPERLSLTANYQGASVHVATQLCGVHWAPAVLAALAAGVAVGVPLATAAEAIAHIEPAPGRMSVFEHMGVTFIRDDWKASLPSVWPAIDFLRSARAARKIAVFGTLSDYGGSAGRVYTRVGRAARDAADIVVFIGSLATRGLRARTDASDHRIVAFATVRAASKYLNDTVKTGDLVLLKGSNPADHLIRLILARTRTVRCWRDRCGRRIFCDKCFLLERPRAVTPSVTTSARLQESFVRQPTHDSTPVGDHVTVVVGLGNPGSEHHGTPHNVGHDVLDALAATLGQPWERDGTVMVAHGASEGRSIVMAKLISPINQSGPALHAWSERLQFGPANCILVYDDADLPLGRIRSRMSGSSGGHRGVASILQAFQTEGFRRVKVGVGRGDGAKTSREYLLTPFEPADRPVIQAACRDAARKVLELANQRSSHRTANWV
jgi:UDP-N-acetylmuramoyl-tripeptide--D-alanyl-D-alanine ligase